AKSQPSNSAPRLFVQWQGAALPAGTERVESSGHSSPGSGAGSYVSDALCSAALLAAHPRFAFQASDGRIFRLLASSGGISVEQGGAVGQSGVNAQPAIQAAIDYAAAVGIGEVRFEREYYELRCPLRTSDSQSFAGDGIPLVVRKTLSLRGVAPKRTLFDFKAHDGGDPETNWQVVELSAGDSSDAVWRGGGIYVIGDYPDPQGDFSVASIELHRLIFQGNRLRTGDHVWPADPIDGDGWDGTDKGFRIQDTFVGEIALYDTDFIGFKGELFYVSGYAPTRIVMERCKLLASNGGAFNVGVPTPWRLFQCEFGDCYIAEETLGSPDGIYAQCIWRDCDSVTMGGGPASAEVPVGYPFIFPNRDENSAPPSILIEGGEFRNCGTINFGSWLRGNATIVDSSVLFDTTNRYGLKDTVLDLDCWIDQLDGLTALALYGPTNLATQIPGAPGGTYVEPPSNVHITLAYRQTELAKANGRQWVGVLFDNLIDPSCSIVVSHAEASTDNLAPKCASPVPAAFPLVVLDRLRDTGAGSYRPASLWQGHVSAGGTITPRAPRICYSAEAGIHEMVLATAPAGGAGFGYADGQLCRVYKTGAAGTLRFAKGASSSFKVPQDRLLANDMDFIEFRWNRWGARWEEQAFFTSA
ncbi:MAG TPA: hypothetical protein VLA37_05165, partial [Sphingomonadaceae bacterium]|nr:hypothetical protein [Sphingomonadaceae bacterium]